MDVRTNFTMAPGMALIFDLDGVIVDSMPMHKEAWDRYLRRHGVVVEDLGTRMHGARNDQIVAELLGGELTPEEIFEHGAGKERLFREMMGHKLEAHLVPGVREFLEASEPVTKNVTDGVTEGTEVVPRKAIASNAEPANVDFVLDGANLRKYFHVTVDGHQVTHPKPFPDVYLRAAELLGVEPGACVVFEDSATGVEAAVRAGMRVVGVATHEKRLENVDLMIRDFRDERLVEWLRGLAHLRRE